MESDFIFYIPKLFLNIYLFHVLLHLPCEKFLIRYSIRQKLYLFTYNQCYTFIVHLLLHCLEIYTFLFWWWKSIFLLPNFFFLHLIHFKATTQKMIRSNQKVQGITCELKHVHTSSKIIIFTNIRTLVKRNCLQITFSSLR